jgi:gluconokinase
VRVLALDVGTSSARTLLFDEEARQVDGVGAQVRYTPSRGHSGRLGVFDPGELVTLCHEVLGEARRGAGAAVDGVGISCFWHSLVALDARGRPLTGVLTWRDARSAPDAQALAARLDPGGVHARTGCPVHPSFWPAKLAWLRREEPEAFAAAARFVSFPDLLVDPRRTSVSMASGTGLLDTRTLAWDEELLVALGLEPERLPALDDDPALALGDGAASNLGTGARVTLSLGTSGALRVLGAGEPKPRPGLFLLRVDRGRFVEGGSLSDGGNLHDWLGRTLRLPEPLVGLAARPPDGHGLTFLTLLGGERAPGWHADARGAVAGLSFETTASDLAQAALEGVGFRFAEIADLLEVDAVTATGKATENDDWMQILADVLERPVAVSAAAEASARGAAVHVLEALGAAPPPAGTARTFAPREERADALRVARERQRALYGTLVGRA